MRLNLFAVAILVFGVAFSVLAQGDEAQLDAILGSDKSLAEKDAACSALKRVATEQSIPILAGLLTDDNLSHSARYVLESMSAAAAGDALLVGLGKTSGSNQIGIIYSLAVRRQTNALSKLAALLAGTDTAVAVAAADAMGRIGGGEAIAALQTVGSSSKGPLHDAEVNGLLTCADGALRKSDRQEALDIFKGLHENEKDEAVRRAAFRGTVLASGDAGVKLVKDAIVGNDPSDQGVALSLARRLSGGETTTKLLCDLLPKAQVPVQIALLQCLQQRNDPSAMAAVASLGDSPDANVRIGAISALGDLGDGSVALWLAGKAAAGEEREAAHQALIDLRRGDVAGEMVRALDNAPAPIQIELIRALGERGVAGPAGALLKAAQDKNDSVRSAAFQALALIAGPVHVPEMVRLVVTAAGDDARSEAADALSAACQHIEAKFGHCDAQPIAEALRSGPPQTRAALFSVCAALVEASTREALRSALNEADPSLREAAMRALCDTRDAALLADLLKLTQIQDNKKIRVLAIRGVVRLTTQEEGAHLSNEEKIHTFAQLLALPLNDDEKRAVLSGLATISDKRAFALIDPLMDDSTVAPEAARAAIGVANATASDHAPEASEALKKILTLSSVTDTERKGAQDALKARQ